MNLKLIPNIIIDAGAYVGYASVFFANRYPEATIVAVEPHPGNFEVLRMNTQSYRRIRPIHAGIWYKRAVLSIQNPEDSYWAFRVEETELEQDGIKGITISDLLNETGAEQIDILKLDIEGAEKEILSFNSEEWLDKVKVLIIELHDYVKPGCSEALYKAVATYGFREFRSGEKIVLYRSEIG